MRIRRENTQDETDEIKMLVFRDFLLILQLIFVVASTIHIVEESEIILLLLILPRVILNGVVIGFVGRLLWDIEEANHQDPRERLNVWELRLFL